MSFSIESTSSADPSYADPAVAAFIVIPLLLVALLLWGTATAWRRSGATREAAMRVTLTVGAAAAIWMAATWMIAATGVFRNWFATPPPFAFLVLSIVALSVVLAFGRVGRHLARFLPLWTLVAVQGFRFPLELAMHALYLRGVMPQEMSYSGRNFDIVTGIAALVLASLILRGTLSGPAARRTVAFWNTLGLLLLINVVAVGVLGTPRFRFFGDDRLNVWITYPPFIWLPAVMVLAALAGHLVIYRALRMKTEDVIFADG